MSAGPHLLGRVPAPDDAHVRAYPLRAATPTGSVEAVIKRPTLDSYDQGATPQCVAFAASKVMTHFNHAAFDAHWLYAQCKLIDGYPGDGTNARFACDVLRRAGHLRLIHGQPVREGVKLKHGIASNRWATTVDEIRACFAGPKPQPVLLGIDWYEAWFWPQAVLDGSDAWLVDFPSAGRVVGGHEIGVWACSDERQAFGLSNTWGASWPPLVWVSYAMVSRMLVEGGDACVLADLPTR